MNVRAYVSSVVVAALVGAMGLTGGLAAGQNPESRTSDGQPNIQGYYAADAPSATHSLEEGQEPDNTLGRTTLTLAEIQEALKKRKVVLVDPDPGPKIPYQPWARAKRREILETIFAPTEITDIEPEDRCALQGVPRINYRGDFQIVQSPGMVTILYEWNHDARAIPLDGRPHLPRQIKLADGDSRGHWEDHTLVVDVTNFDDETWFDAHASFHSDALHVTERWTVVDSNRINYEATMDDPKVFTRPWRIAFPVDRLKDANHELMEEACVEGNGGSIEATLGAGRTMKAKGIKGRHEHSPGFYDE